MQKIIPHLWFDKEANEAFDFYSSIFPDSKLINKTTLKDTPSGDADALTFVLAGYTFMAINAGPLFKFNPSISFFLNFDPSKDPKAEENLNKFWEKLSEGGSVLMELQEYDFSKRYGWLEDKYGVSWQLILTDPEGEPRPFIVPSLLYTQDVAGKSEEAINFYTSVFKNSKVGTLARYPEGSTYDKPETLMFADFTLEDQWFAAMDSAHPDHKFKFNEAVSLLVRCEDQKEIDYFWEKLSAYPEAEQCGWLKDKFGVSWQIAPVAMEEMMEKATPEQMARVTEAFLKMKKFDLDELEKAYKGE
jgi:predicted 3-demethylubiquinone-9 3-methyltransferase (glyoxalase superfamily)